MAGNIEEYTARREDLATGPGNRMAEAHVQAGRRIDISYNQAGAAKQLMGHELGAGIGAVGKEFVEQEEHEQVRRLSQAHTSLFANLNQAWNETVKQAAADGKLDDPTVARKFQEEVVSPALDKFRESAGYTRGAQQWADHRTMTLRQHFFEKTTADQATMAGHAAVTGVEKSVNTLAASVVANPDEHTLDEVIGMHKENARIAASSPVLKGVEGVRIQQEITQKGLEHIVTAAIESAIRKSPEEGMRMAQSEKYAQYLQPGTASRFAADVRREKAFERSEQRAQQQWAKEQQRQKGEETLHTLLRDWNSENPQMGRDVIHRLEAGGELPGPWYEHALNVYNRMTKEDTPARISQNNLRDIIRRIDLPPGDPGRISDVSTITESFTTDDKSKQISKADFAYAMNYLHDARSEDGQKWSEGKRQFLARVQPMIVKSVMGQVLSGPQSLKMRAFEEELDRRADELGKKDRWKLLREGNPEYMATPDIIRPYQVPLDARLQEDVNRTLHTIPKQIQQNRPPLGNFRNQ